MTGAFEPYTDEEWRQRLTAAVKKTLADKAARRAEREAFKARRDAGLKLRYAAKERRAARGSRGTNRGRGEPMPETPECCREAEDGVCAQHLQAAAVWPWHAKYARTRPAAVVGQAGRAKPEPEPREETP